MSFRNDDYLLVAAIDFGTAYSGYAFSTRGEYAKDPLKVIPHQAFLYHRN